MLLIKTKMEGANVSFQPLSDQAIESEITVKMEDLKIAGDFIGCTKYPIGTTFIIMTGGHTFPEPDFLNLAKELTFPLFTDSTVYNLSNFNKDNLKEVCDYVINHMIDSSEFGVDKAKEYYKEFEQYGYTFDWSEKIEVSLEPSKATPNLKRSLSIKYPVPDEKECNFHIEPDLWHLAVRNVIKGQSTMVTGPTGLKLINL